MYYPHMWDLCYYALVIPVLLFSCDTYAIMLLVILLLLYVLVLRCLYSYVNRLEIHVLLSISWHFLWYFYVNLLSDCIIFIICIYNCVLLIVRSGTPLWIVRYIKMNVLLLDAGSTTRPIDLSSSTLPLCVVAMEYAYSIIPSHV